MNNVSLTNWQLGLPSCINTVTFVVLARHFISPLPTISATASWALKVLQVKVVRLGAPLWRFSLWFSIFLFPHHSLNSHNRRSKINHEAVMEIILMIRKMLEITGITPNDSIFCTVVRIAMPLNLVYLNVTTACFVLFEGDNFGDITKALSGVVMYFYVLCVYIIFLILRQSVFGMLEMLADKIEEREQLGSGNLYKEVNEKIDKITNTVGVVMYGIVLPSFLVPPMILSFYLYFARGAGKSAFILVFPTS